MKKNTSLVLSNEFEGRQITTFFYKDRPCWIAREIGEALSYSREGRRFINNISEEWKDEFIEGHDFIILGGQELADFKKILGADTESVSAYASHVMILFETGVHMALTKTDKPAGKRLRRFIVDEVLPQISRDGSYIPGRKVEDSKVIDDAERDAARRLRLAEDREARLNRQLKSKAMKDLVKTLKRSGHVSEDIITSLEIQAVELAMGKKFPALHPKIDREWLSPTDIAKKFGVSIQRVGLIITQLGLRGNLPGLSMGIVNKARHSDRTVISYLYSLEAVMRIEKYLKDSGLIKGE